MNRTVPDLKAPRRPMARPFAPEDRESPRERIARWIVTGVFVAVLVHEVVVYLGGGR